MKITDSTIPEDKRSLQALLLKYREENTTLQDKIKELEEENRVIKEESSGLQSMLSRLRKMIFGPRSEKRTFTDPKQGLMFDEIEYNAEKTVKQERKIQVKGHERRKPVRRKLPEGIPRRLIEVHLHKDDLICEHGNEFKPIGKEITEKLDMIPPQFLVLQYARIKYALNGCEPSTHSAVRIAPMPPVLLPKSIAAEGLMAYFLISKYCDRLPLYHLEKMMSRYGIDYPRSTMCEELLQIYELYGDGLKEALTSELFKAPVMEIDETTLQVLNEPGRKNTTPSYMFVMKGGAKKKPVIYFTYRETRSPDFLLEFLDGFKGKVITDGYPAYDKVMKKLNLSHAGCNQHCRRNFYYVAQSKDSVAEEALEMFGHLYEIEQFAKEKKLSSDEIKNLRQEKSKPIMERLKTWVDNLKEKVAPKSPLGEAIQYCHNQWSKLILFLDDGNIPFDTNSVENAIRPFVIGRKNFYFSGSPRGAHGSALFYTIIETAKANGLEPYWYIRFLFSKLPYAKTIDDYIAILPTNIAPHELEAFKIDIIKTFK